jgi:hypothetical protein
MRLRSVTTHGAASAYQEQYRWVTHVKRSGQVGLKLIMLNSNPDYLHAQAEAIYQRDRDKNGGTNCGTGKDRAACLLNYLGVGSVV